MALFYTSSIESSAAALAVRLAEARRRTDELFAILRPDALYDRPIPQRHRLVFYLGHLEAFDWNLIAVGAGITDGAKPEFDKLFAFGIDPLHGDLPSDEPADWPNESAIREYNAEVRHRLDQLLSTTDPILVQTAIEHRLMHAETLAYLLHELPLDRKIPQAVLRGRSCAPAQPEIAFIPAGVATLGQKRSDGGFGWDNEFEETPICVPEFGAAKYPITNADFLEFVRAGGYAERSLWSADDWTWKERAGVVHPHFWRRHGEEWRLRAMFAEVPFHEDWPVFVSHAEASAYARWTGKRLPTEAEWHRMAYGTPQGTERQFPWGDEPPMLERGNFDFAAWDAKPVQSHPQGRSAFGLMDLVGNGWEWTSTPFGPLPGFEPFPFYPGYSVDFFDGMHYVMKGGSHRTAAPLLRRSFRNWFQPHYPYGYAKFRCVQD